MDLIEQIKRLDSKKLKKALEKEITIEFILKASMLR